MEKDPSAPADPVQPYPPVQQEQPYPSYPQQEPYPAQQPYPVQQPYPQQPYPPAGYPPQELGLMSEAPPPYTTLQTSNTVVVQSQPQPVVQTFYQPTGTGDYGIAALVFAIITTAFIFFCGCWWALLCTGIGIALAIGASSSASNGDLSAAKTYNTGSLLCTVCGVVSIFIGFVVFIIYIAVAISSASGSS